MCLGAAAWSLRPSLEHVRCGPRADDGSPGIWIYGTSQIAVKSPRPLLASEGLDRVYPRISRKPLRLSLMPGLGSVYNSFVCRTILFPYPLISPYALVQCTKYRHMPLGLLGIRDPSRARYRPLLNNTEPMRNRQTA